MLRALLLVVTLVGACAPAAGDPLESGADSIESQAKRKKKPKKPKFTKLEGTWVGSIEESEYGPISGSFHVSADGVVVYSVVVQGSVWQDQAAIESWNGTSITVVVQGRAYTVSASLDGDQFTAMAPFVGEVQVKRVSK